MSDLDVVSYHPPAEEYAWTFGGAAPVRTVRPGTVLELWTDACFAGNVRTNNDLVSVVCEFPFLNPQTGPFFTEGAEPGDTLAVHLVSIEPSRDWAASATVPPPHHVGMQSMPTRGQSWHPATSLKPETRGLVSDTKTRGFQGIGVTRCDTTPGKSGKRRTVRG